MEEEKWKGQRELLACRWRKRPPAKEVEKARKKNLPSASREGHSPADTLILAQSDSGQASTYGIVSNTFVSFQPLNLS